MKLFKQFLKFSGVFVLILTFVSLSGLYTFIFLDPWALARARAKTLSKFCRWGLKVMGVNVQVEGPLKLGESQLVVSNHLSYLDMLVISAKIPSCFVTSVEIKETPFLGHISKWGGCLFVERRSRDNLEKEISEITEALKNQVNVTIFPEATSTDGSEVLRFKRPLYASSVYSGQPILPICLNYTDIDGKKLNLKNRDFIYWYGDMPFFSHLWSMMSLENVSVTLTPMQKLSPSENQDVAVLAERSHSMVKKRFQPCTI